MWAAQAALGLHIVRFPEALEAALTDLKPNLIADYAFNLAGAYNSFYAECQACQCFKFDDGLPAECHLHVACSKRARCDTK